MQLSSKSVYEILRDNSPFFIPPYQRAYTWEEDQWERYLSDLKDLLASELDEAVPTEHKKQHYFGTIVIKPETKGLTRTQIVVDGQQRLTTNLLFIIALRDTDLTPKEVKPKINSMFLYSDESIFEEKIKLKQVTSDWQVFKDIISSKNQRSYSTSQVYKGYRYFKSKINTLKSLYPNIKADNIFNVISRLNLAVIQLDEAEYKGENPQIIFETLNSIGKPLSLSDLIRNCVLINYPSEKQSDVFEYQWFMKVEAVLGENTSLFIRDYLQLKLSVHLKVIGDNNTKALYTVFKKFVSEKFDNDYQLFLNDITRYAIWYSWIIDDNINSISSDKKNNVIINELLHNIIIEITSKPFTPFILGLLEYHQNETDNKDSISDEQLIKYLDMIRSYLIRRRLLNLTQGENKEIVSKCKNIPDIVSGSMTLVELFSSLTYNVRFPDDEEVRLALTNSRFYKDMSNYSKFILGKIEEYRAKRVIVDYRNPNITIEHIMPQTLNQAWKEELGENYLETYNQYLHNIGNLILTEKNIELSNKAYKEKRKVIRDSNLNYRFVLENEENWNQASILRHQKQMIDDFLSIFPLPQGYQTNNTETILSYSPSNNDIVNLTGSKPILFTIEGTDYEVNSWTKLYLTFLSHIKNSRPEDFNGIIECQSQLLVTNLAITDINTLISSLNSLEEKTKTLNFYRTLDGKVAKDTMDPITTIFHTNASVDTINTRIIKLIDFLNIPNESIVIKYKFNNTDELDSSDNSPEE